MRPFRQKRFARSSFYTGNFGNRNLTETSNEFSDPRLLIRYAGNRSVALLSPCGKPISAGIVVCLPEVLRINYTTSFRLTFNSDGLSCRKLRFKFPHSGHKNAAADGSSFEPVILFYFNMIAVYCNATQGVHKTATAKMSYSVIESLGYHTV